MEPATFAELSLSPKVLAAVLDAGYSTPTPIQAQAIPVAVTGRDILGIAQTGTGKTAAFVMPMICRLETGRARARMPRSLILAPTRELAAQVAQSFEKYGKNHKLAVALLIGGTSMDEQTAKLDRGVDVLIATPGRLLDHFQRGRIMLMGVEILVIDEADRMLDMGFIPDIEKICKLLPPKRQTLFFSATMPPEITRLTQTFLTDPLRVEVARPATTAATITQRFVYCPDGEDFAKRDVLRQLIRSQEKLKNAIIFCNRKKDVAILHKSLVKHGFNAGALHGDMEQSARTATLDKFRAGEITILAASDVAARGLDIPDVSHVFNFDVPWQGDDYVHRIGRTGRAGREGFSATLVTLDDIKAIGDIEKITGEAPVWLGDAPSADELAEGATRKRRRGKPTASARGRAAVSDRGKAAVSERSDRGGREVRSGRDDRGDRSGPPRRERGGERLDRMRGERAPRPQSDPVRAAEPVPHEPRDAREQREPRNAREQREPRDTREQREPRDTREQREPRDTREPRQVRAPREPREQPEPRRDQRPQRSAPSHVAGAGDQPVVSGAPFSERPVQAHSEPRHDPRPPRGDRPQRQDGPRREHRRDEDGPRVGFDDNVPAFLRKPVKAAR